MRISSNSSPRIGQKPTEDKKEVVAKKTDKSGGRKDTATTGDTILARKTQGFDLLGANILSTEGRIRSAESAKETAQSLSDNILSSPSSAILAQANIKPQGIIQFFE